MNEIGFCEFNLGVGCSKYDRHCKTCGWNPVVAEKRKKNNAKKNKPQKSTENRS